MIRPLKFFVTFALIFCSINILVASNNNPKRTDNQNIKTEKESQKKIEKNPIGPDLNNDHWQFGTKKYRIPEKYEGIMPLLTNKKQPVA